MKMSDIFNLPLFAKNHDVGARCSIYEGRGVTVASSFYANQLKSYEAMCAAVNSHDRLESENARLREFVKKVAELDIETFLFETQDGDEDFIEYICTDILDDANELLEELEKSNARTN
jgi:hypothetical protein